MKALNRSGKFDQNQEYTVAIARSLNDMMEVIAVRASVYVSEQSCPFDEEFDGNDFAAATHLLVRHGREPVGTMRIRWFADFAKVERVAIRIDRRGGQAAAALIAFGHELISRKGYRKALGHIEARLLPFWKRSGAHPRPGRDSFAFSDREYIEVERDYDPHPNAITLDTPALVLLRPEGEWDEPGVLDRSSVRGVRARERQA